MLTILSYEAWIFFWAIKLKLIYNSSLICSSWKNRNFLFKLLLLLSTKILRKNIKKILRKKIFHLKPELCSTSQTIFLQNCFKNFEHLKKILSLSLTTMHCWTLSEHVFCLKFFKKFNNSISGTFLNFTILRSSLF